MTDSHKHMRIALGIEYDGSLFFGFQTQKNERTVQNTLEQALSKVAQSPIKVICAGRTDTGVHALGQVIHFDTPVQRTIQAWVAGGNTCLPHDITIRWARSVDPSFHARSSAIARHYRYILYNYPTRHALFRHHLLHWSIPLDETLMQEALPYFLLEHDFSSFRSAACQASSPIRHIHTLTLTRKEDWIILDVVANGFLHHMIRNMMGVLLDIGMKKHPPQWAQEVLMARDRTQASITAPSQGLYLVAIDYPQKFNLPLPQDLSPFFIPSESIIDKNNCNFIKS